MEKQFVELTKEEMMKIDGGMQLATSSGIVRWAPYAGGLLGGFGAGYIIGKNFA